LEISSSSFSPDKKIAAKNEVIYSGNYLLRSTQSVESDRFSQRQSEQFFSQRDQVTPESNRMGIKLSGEPIEFEEQLEITSCGLSSNRQCN